MPRPRTPLLLSDKIADAALALKPPPGLKALALAVSGRLDEAVDCARLAVDHSGTAAQRLKHAGNLARLLANAGRRQVHFLGRTGGMIPIPQVIADTVKHILKEHHAGDAPHVMVGEAEGI